VEREFKKWFKKNQKRFAHSQLSDIEIAYSAWEAGRAQAKAERKALEELTRMGDDIDDVFTLTLSKEETKWLYECLSRTSAKGDALTLGMNLEDKLYNFFKT